MRFERPTGVPVQLRLSGGVASGIEFDAQKVGTTGGQTLLETTGAATAADRYSIEIFGGVNRASVVEIAG